MLTSYSISTANDLVRRMSDKGYDLVAHNDSPLHLLNNLTIGTKAIIEAKNQSTPLDPRDIIGESKHKSLDGVFEHDEAMELYVKNGGKAITDIMALARTGVMADTKSVLESYNDNIDDVALEIKEPFNLVPNNYSNIWGLSQFEMSIRRFENVPYQPVNIPVGFGEIDEYDLKQLLQFGISSLDDVLEKWLDDQPLDKLMRVYDSVFVARTWDPSKPLDATYKTSEGMDRNDILAAYLMALNLEEKLVDNVDLSFKNLQNVANNTMSTVGRNLCQILKRRQSDTRLGVMVYDVTIENDKYDRDGKRTIYVNGDVYNNFIQQEDGSNAAIFGAVINGGKLTLKHILENQEKFEKLYLKRKELHNQESASIVFAAKKDVVRICMSRFVAERNEEDLPALKGRVQEVLAEKLDQLQPKDLIDVPVAIRNMVCDVLYPGTNARAFLDAMDTAEIENPGISSRECALLSSIDLIARWLADQIKTKPVVR